MICYAEIEFMIHNSHSLKEKRAVLQRMITRTKQKYNVSIAEIDHQNVWQRTKLGIVSISSSKQNVEHEINNALSYLQSNPEWEMLDIWKEFL